MARAKREADEARRDGEALAYWFGVSGTTMTDLEAALDRWPCAVGDIILPGLDPRVSEPVSEAWRQGRISDGASLLIVFAMQRLSFRRLCAQRAAQADLFGATNEGRGA
jgi:hypothetical protein